MRRPKQLKPGSRVAAVCLSHGIAGALPELFDWGRQQLAQHLGLELVPMTHTLRSFDELYQQPALRVADFYEAWERPDIDGVISVIGGDDSVRLIPRLDPQRLRKHHDHASLLLALRSCHFLRTGGAPWFCGFRWAFALKL